MSRTENQKFLCIQCGDEIQPVAGAAGAWPKRYNLSLKPVFVIPP